MRSTSARMSSARRAETSSTCARKERRGRKDTVSASAQTVTSVRARCVRAQRARHDQRAGWYLLVVGDLLLRLRNVVRRIDDLALALALGGGDCPGVAVRGRDDHVGHEAEDEDAQTRVAAGWREGRAGGVSGSEAGKEEGGDARGDHFGDGRHADAVCARSLEEPLLCARLVARAGAASRHGGVSSTCSPRGEPRGIRHGLRTPRHRRPP